MDQLNPILEKLLQSRSKAKLSGAIANNRFSFQGAVSLNIMIESYDKCDNFFAIFDYQEDFILFAQLPSSFVGSYYQVKTSTKNWTIDSLTKKEDKDSILSKMFDLGHKHTANFLYFISNKKFKALKNGAKKTETFEEIALLELDQTEKDKIINHLSGHSIKNLTDITTLKISALPISNNDRDNQVIGALARFISDKYADSKYSPQTMFLSVTNEIERRMRYEQESKNIEELKEVKCLSKEEFKTIIERNIEFPTLQKRIEHVENQLRSESVPYTDILELRNSIQRLNNLRITHPSSYNTMYKEMQTCINTANSSGLTLIDISKEFVTLLSSNSAFMEKIEKLGINSKEILSMVIYEINEIKEKR